MKTTVLLFLFLVGFAETSFAQWGIFGPSDYDECILEEMEGVTSDLAARAIIMSCREKFPSQGADVKAAAKLTPIELQNVENIGGSWAGRYTSFDIYNRNSFAIKSIIFELVMFGDDVETKRYDFSGTGCILGNPSDTQVVQTMTRPAEYKWNFRIKSAEKC